MHMDILSHGPGRCHPRPLAVLVSALSLHAACGNASEHAHLPIVTSLVTRCADDGGSDTLRNAVLTANDGGTIDLTALACSRITLAGAINVDVNNLTIIGAGADALTIDANHAGRAFMHSGSGTLSLQYMTVSNGSITLPTALGGCIYSKGSVTLNHATVADCQALGQAGAGGGGIVALYQLTMLNSVLSGNSAVAAVGASGTTTAEGGGAVVLGHLNLVNSTVSGNLVHTVAGKAIGGGLYVHGTLSCKYSTIDTNTASVAQFSAGGGDYGTGGGLAFMHYGSGQSFTMSSCSVHHNMADAGAGVVLSEQDNATASIRNSTISTNTANYEGGGLVEGTRLTLSNSTVAFNVAGSYGGGGLIASGDTLTMESSIVADNGPSGSAFAADLDGTSTVSGHNNIVKVVGTMVILPIGTVRLDPQLGPLRDNGGITHTHALLPASPAIDSGNNKANLGTDQRSTGFPRVIGIAADIGAFEFDPDVIFINGFN